MDNKRLALALREAGAEASNSGHIWSASHSDGTVLITWVCSLGYAVRVYGTRNKTIHETIKSAVAMFKRG